MVQEITTQSWGSRIIGSFFGILIGIALIIASFVLIFWNEGHGLHTAKSLEETQAVIISVPTHPIDPKNNQKVIYLNGLATTTDVLNDAFFGVSEKALKLQRKVEMYEWRENVDTKTEKEMGGSERTIKTYNYEPVWSEKLIDSQKFKDQAQHQNPTTMPIKTVTNYAEKVTVGDFTLPHKLIWQLDNPTQVDLSKLDTAALQSKFDNKTVQHDDNGLYIGSDPDNPQVGDLRIVITAILPQDISLIGQQSNNTLVPYHAPAGQDVLLLEMGNRSPQEMIHAAQVENRTVTWILRAISLMLMIVGISLILQPLTVIADVVPFIGRVIGFGMGLIAFIAGLFLWAIATAIAWFTFRPIPALILVICISVICYLLFVVRKRQPNPQ